MTLELDNVVGIDAFLLRVNDPDIYAFVRGTNDRIYCNTYHLNLGWKGWSALPSGTTPSGIAAARYNGKICLVVRGSNNRIYYGEYDELSEGFSGWSEVGGATGSKPAVAIYQDSEYLWVVVRGMDDGIYIIRQRSLNRNMDFMDQAPG